MLCFSVWPSAITRMCNYNLAQVKFNQSPPSTKKSPSPRKREEEEEEKVGGEERKNGGAGRRAGQGIKMKRKGGELLLFFL